MDFRNLNVAVVGLGTSGKDACRLMKKMGSIVRATEENVNDATSLAAEELRRDYFDVELGAHNEDFLKDIDLMVVSPGVSPDSLPVRYAVRMSVPVISEMELGFSACRGKVLAVTGTNGKSTVVTLLGKILEKAGLKHVVCGNIGNSLSGEIDSIDADTLVVLEVSSFQLEWAPFFKPAVSCVLNITEDHLDRYKSLDDYAYAKYRIFINQDEKDIVVLNYDDPRLREVPFPVRAKKLYYSMRPGIEGMYFAGGKVMRSEKGREEVFFEMPQSALKGGHNIENVMAAALIAGSRGVAPDIIREVVAEYRMLSHRIEVVGETGGVTFIDDSKATNIDSVKRALDAMENRVVLIAGGRDKGGDYGSIAESIKAKVSKLILIGEASARIKASYKGIVDIEEAASLESAVEMAHKSAGSGGTVLLSPMCSSFDMFRDYKHRGDVFRKAVGNIQKESAEKRA